jgi:hypothetical protein
MKTSDFNCKYISLKDYTNEQLIALINMAEDLEMTRLGPICAEILRRMNEKNSILEIQNEP